MLLLNNSRRRLQNSSLNLFIVLRAVTPEGMWAVKDGAYQQRNRIARELYDAFAQELAEVSYRVDEAIGMNSTNAQTRESLRSIRSGITELINKSHHLREEKFELTPREKEVLSILATGSSTKEISETLFLSEATIKTHIAGIYRKLDAKNKVSAIEQARKLGLLSQ